MKIKVDDTVQVISGADKGTVGKVISVDHQSGKIVVEGVNKVYKHVRRSQKNPQGGRLNKEMPIYASNVMVVDGGQTTRVGYRYLKDGSKERYAKETGNSLGVVSGPNPKYAS